MLRDRAKIKPIVNSATAWWLTPEVVNTVTPWRLQASRSIDRVDAPTLEITLSRGQAVSNTAAVMSSVSHNKASWSPRAAINSDSGNGPRIGTVRKPARASKPTCGPGVFWNRQEVSNSDGDITPG